MLDPFRVRGLVFDLDGTLVDSYQAIATSLNHARAGYGLCALPTAEVRRSVGHGLEVLVAEQVGPDRVEEGVRRFRERYAEVFRSQTFALPAVNETLGELRRRGYRLSVASNKPARFGEEILRELDLLGYLDCVEGPDRAGSTKPDPTMLHRCLRAMGVSPGEAVYVGDMTLDVETAARADVPVLLVGGGSSSVEELRATGERVLGSLRELLDMLPPREPREANRRD